MKTTTTTRKSFEKYDGKHYLLYYNEQEKEMPAMQQESEEQTAATQTQYEYDTCIAECAEPTIAAFTEALAKTGQTDAEISATDIMLRAVQQGIAEGDTTELAKKLMLAVIDQYDRSDSVNSFRFNGMAMWLDRETRRTLRERLAREETKGSETTRITYGSVTFTLPVDTAKSMLESLENYATECFDKTAEHQQAVAELTDTEEILAYDYTAGYPTKLEF